MPLQDLTPPPTAPARSDAPEVFIERADAFVAWFPTFVSQMQTLTAQLEATAALIGAAPAYSDPGLVAMTGNTPAADKFIYFTSSSASAIAAVTSQGRTLIAQASQANMRTTGLGMSANGSSLVAANDYAAMRGLLGIDTGYLVPAGVIAMWSGSIGSIPAGWALCDGGSGTPDLRGRFIVGAGGGYGVGNTGGTDSHNHGGAAANYTLTSADIPAHHHDMFVSGSVGDISAVGSGQTAAVGTNSSPGESEYVIRPLAGTPNAGITGDTGGNGGHGHGIGSSDHRPPFYALAYIMKL